MISCNKGNVHMEGSLTTIEAEVSTLLYSFYHDGLIPTLGKEAAKKDMEKIFDRTFRDIEDLKKEAIKKIKEADFDRALKMLDEFFKEMEEDSNE